MHAAPSVLYPVVRSVRVAGLQLLAWGLGAATVAAWMVQVDEPIVGARVAAVLWLVATGWWAWRSWAAADEGRLAWDGQHWRWEPDARRQRPAAAGTLRSVLDLQSLMLLHMAPAAGRGIWLWVDRDAAPALWHGLRCAVQARTRANEPAGAQARLP